MGNYESKEQIQKNKNLSKSYRIIKGELLMLDDMTIVIEVRVRASYKIRNIHVYIIL